VRDPPVSESNSDPSSGGKDGIKIVTAEERRTERRLMQPKELPWCLLEKMSRIKNEINKTEIVQSALLNLQRDIRTEKNRIEDNTPN
jgi:hypothetical protein